MAAYYNEFDKFAAAWLRELIKQGLIADGDVDERSILDVSADDLVGYTQCHFFAGIGGWSYALRLAGWPDDLAVWTGSPPCQPFSSAGRQLGKDDPRHLAPHFINLVRAGRPAVLFGEQVASAEVFGGASKPAKRKGPPRNGAKTPQWAWLDDLQDRLEAAHYSVGALDISSSFVGAPHVRQRTFFGALRMANPLSQQRHEGLQQVQVGSAERAWGDSEPRLGMGHPDDAGLQEHGGLGELYLRKPFRSDSGRQHLDASLLGWLADMHRNGRFEIGERIPSAGHDGPVGDGALGGMADTEHDGYRREEGYAPEQGRDGAEDGLSDRDGSSDGVADPERERRGARGDGDSGGCVGNQHPADGQDDGPREADSFWGAADWLFCRDGKWRPVEPGTFPLAVGLPPRVGLVCATCLEESADSANDEDLQALRCVSGPFDGRLPPKVLQPIMCVESPNENTYDPRGGALAGPTPLRQPLLRRMWGLGGEPPPPHRREPDEQQHGEHSDSLQEMPQLSAQKCERCGAHHPLFEVTLKGNARPERLRGYGNAINPWAGKKFIGWFIEALFETIFETDEDIL